MRAAAQRLMEWYHTNYWSPQSEYLKEMSSLCLSSDVRTSSSESTVLIPKEQQTEYHTDPDLPIFLEDSPTFNSLIKLSGSTFITEIFTPLFLCSVYSHDLPHGTVSMKIAVKSKKLRRTFELWWGRTLKIQESSSRFFGIICTRLFVGALDVLENGTEMTPRSPGVSSRVDIEWRLAVCESWIGKLFRQSVKQLIQAVNGRNSESERDAHIHEEIRNRFTQEIASRGGGTSGALRLRYNEMLCVLQRAGSAGKKKSGAALKWLEGLENVLCSVEMILDTDLLHSCVTLLSEEYKRIKSGSAEDEGEQGEGGVEGESDFDGSVHSGDDHDHDDISDGDHDSNDNDDGEDDDDVSKDEDVVAQSASTDQRVIPNIDINIRADDKEGERLIVDHALDNIVRDTSNRSDSNSGGGRGGLKRRREDDCMESSHSQVKAPSSPSSSSSSSSSGRQINMKNTPIDVNNSSNNNNNNNRKLTDNSNKKENVSKSIHQMNHKNTHKQTPRGWTVCSDHSAWPLGMLQGEALDGLGRCPLYLLTEVTGR